MKRLFGLVMLSIMLLLNVAFAENSAYSILNDLERQIFDALTIMLGDFENPSSFQLLKMGDYLNCAPYREPSHELYNILAGGDEITVQIQGEKTPGSYYRLYLSNWEHPEKGAAAKEQIEKGDTPKQLLGLYYLSYCRVGDYVERSDEDIESKLDEIDSELADCNKINMALNEHWGKPSDAQESVCYHDIWSMGCDVLTNKYCAVCHKDATLYKKEVCSVCSGTGKIRCVNCRGTGRSGNRGCLSCLGSGSDFCTSCTGGFNLIFSDDCLECGSEPQCCKYYAFHDYMCPICSQDAYSKFDNYKEIIRDSEQYIGNAYRVSGVVESVTQSNDKDTYELCIKENSLFSKRNYCVLYHKNELSPILLVGDKVTLFGVFTGIDDKLEPLLVSAHAELSK